eukprot:Pgem_evm1s18751
MTFLLGLFRKTCELTLKVLRRESPSLINMLTPFVYDPVEDTDDTKAWKVINTVKNKLH